MSGEDGKDRDVNGESRVEKFDGTPEGWPDFKSRIILHLERHDLDEMITGDDEPSLSNAKDKKASKRARAAIMLALDENCRKSLEENKTAFSVFKALTALFEQKSRGNLLRAERVWYQLKMSENESINTFINRVKSAAKSIAAHTVIEVFGQPPNDSMVVNRVLAGLPERFDTFIQNLDQIEVESTMSELTLNKLTNQLMNFEAKTKDSDRSQVNVIAFKATTDLATQVAKLQQQMEQISANISAPLTKRRMKGDCHVHPWAKHNNDRCFTQHPELRPDYQNNQTANKLTFGYRMAPAITSASVAVPSARHKLNNSHGAFPAAISFCDDNTSEMLCLVDSGCSWHMTQNDVFLTNITEGDCPNIELGDNSIIDSKGIGIGTLALDNGKTGPVPNMLHVPKLGKSLLSMGQATTVGLKFVADGDFMTIYAKEGYLPPAGQVLASIPKVDNLYPMRLVPPTPQSSSTKDPSTGIVKSELAIFADRGPSTVEECVWHQRLAHVNSKDLHRLTKNGRSLGINISNKMKREDSFCGPCLRGKMAKGAFLPSENRTRRPGEIVGSDLEGPFPVTGLGGWRYYVSYIDYYTRFFRVYLLKQKSDQLEALRLFEIEMFSKFAAPVRRLETLQTDNAGEYLSNESKDYYREKNILHRTIVAGDSQQHGLTERLNRTILEAADAVRYGANMPANTWPMAVLFVAYILVRRPHSALSGQITPFQAWTGRVPNLSHLRVFGCDAYYRVPDSNRIKLQPRARRAVMIGYSGTQKAYRLWDVESKKMVVSRDVVFHETSFSFGFDRNRSKQLVPPALQNTFESTIPTHNRFDFLHHESDSEEESIICEDENEKDRDEATMTESTERRSSRRTRPPIERFEAGTCDIEETNNSANQLLPCLAAVVIGDCIVHDPTSVKHSVEKLRKIPPKRTILFAPNLKRLSARFSNIDHSSSTFEENENETSTESDAKHVSETVQNMFANAMRQLPPEDTILPRPCLEGVLARDIHIPATVEEAINGPYGGYWADALRAEFNQMHTFNVFSLQAKPDGRKAIASKWVFDVKPSLSGNGSIRKFKCRLVIKGFSQRAGIDYDETFAPVAHQESIRALLALAAENSFKLRLVDIVGAFLNGEVEEDLYMTQPEGFFDPEKGDHVLKLLKALYGLKQAGRLWNKQLNDYLINDMQFTCIRSDPCIYLKRSSENLMIMAVHVDDILLVHNNDDLCNETISLMSARWEITDLGQPTRLLGMRLQHNLLSGTISLDQEEYVEELLKRFKMVDCKQEKTPHQPGVYLTKELCPRNHEEEIDMATVPYGQLVGSLLWLSTNTRPDIATAVSTLCRFVANPGRSHWKAAQRVLRYLAGTRKFGICFSKTLPDIRDISRKASTLIGYSDSDWAGEPETRRSTSGYVFLSANGPIAWKSSLQKSVSLSSVEAEYVALCSASREAFWLRQLHEQLGFPITEPTPIGEDNRGCEAITKNDRTDARTKHIQVKYHYTRELVRNGDVEIQRISTRQMVADIFTKPIDAAKFLWCRDQLGVRDLKMVTQSRGRVEVDSTISHQTV